MLWNYYTNPCLCGKGSAQCFTRVDACLGQEKFIHALVDGVGGVYVYAYNVLFISEHCLSARASCCASWARLEVGCDRHKPYVT